MPEFAQGLQLNIPDRDEFEQYINDNSSDPGVYYDTWGDNGVPEAIYIVSYTDDEHDPYYHCLNAHVNSVVNSHYHDAALLQEMLDEGVLEKDGYDVDFVNEHK